MEKDFATTNFVLGIGSFTYQMVTRDTFGFAVKATYGELESYTTSIDPAFAHHGGVEKSIECREIFKNPVTDDGTKKSAKGLLRVDRNEEGKLVLRDQVTKEEEKGGELLTVFLDGELARKYTLADIRATLESQMTKPIVNA